MKAFLLVFFLCFAAAPSQAWNAAGHRLVARIAWQQMSPATREAAVKILAGHPDYPRWQQKGNDDPAAIFAEAATWADTIRSDTRYYDEKREAPKAALPGLSDTARHKAWHYVDTDKDGKRREGELDQQIVRLGKILRSTAGNDEKIGALPWLLHLVGDAHQPLHVGRLGDNGGNDVEIENPFNPRLPFTNLHSYWDDLPGAPWLRGRRLDERADALLASHSAPPRAPVDRWLEESRQLHRRIYPAENGSLLPLIDETFHAQAREIADQRLTDAGYRLGWLLNEALGAAVPHETAHPVMPRN